MPVRLGGNSDGRSTGERLQVDPNQGSILFLGTNQDGLWKSAGTGPTWNKVTSFGPTSTTLVLFDLRTGQRRHLYGRGDQFRRFGHQQRHRAHGAFLGTDFNSDGKPDILWQNSVTGERGTWLMNGTAIRSWLSFGSVPTGWRMAGTDDFTSDGRADFLWENSGTGEHILWYMNGTTFVGWADLGTVPIDWRAVACADFDANGSADILGKTRLPANTASG